ncbi:MAG: RNA polymerase sigma factor [Clostridia bacterium]|nr:RNA polymerase sigma factor [Clostridia bacterium]
MTDFEKLIKAHYDAVERFVNYKIHVECDAQDVMQDVLLSAFENFGQLKNIQSFRPWIIGIARNKCNAYYRKKAKYDALHVNDFDESLFTYTQFGLADDEPFDDIFDNLSDKDKQILKFTYFDDLSQNEIAEKLHIPLGTVKSRLHTAKQKIRKTYSERKVDDFMKKLPQLLPDYKIIESDEKPFDVICKELKGLSIIPELNEKVLWGLYEFRSKKLEEYSETKVCGKAEIHGVEGVEILSNRHDVVDNREQKIEFAAQLTDTHCRYLAATYYEKDRKKQFTFLDDVFVKNWGFGENNCGNEVLITCNNLVKRNGNNISYKSDKEFSDIAGRYTVEICGKTYDTICVMSLGHFDNSVVIEQYLDQNGRTILWRRFNKNDLMFKKYNKLWTEMLPGNEKLIVNGETFVHWYDCITDYIL